MSAMNKLFLALPVTTGLLLAGFSAEIDPTPPTPPAKLLDGGWKASWSPDGRQLVYGKGERC